MHDNSTESEYKITVFEDNKNYYTCDRVNVRSGAGTEYDKVEVLARDVKVKVLGETDNGWYQIMVGDEVGYVSADYLLSSSDRMLIDISSLSGEEQEVILKMISCLQK